MSKKKKVLIAVAAVLVAIPVVGRIALPGIIRSQVESKGSEALGVPVTLGRVGLSVFGGSVELRDFAVAQPEGFDGDDPLFRFDRVAVDVDLGSLRSERIVVESVEVEGPKVALLRDGAGKLNFVALQENLAANAKPSESEGGSEAGGDSQGAKKALELRSLTVKGVAVSFDAAAEGASPAARVVLSQDSLELSDVVYDPAGGAAPFELRLGGIRVEGPGAPWSTAAPFTLDSLSLQADLASFTAGAPHIKDLRIGRPQVVVEQDAAGGSNLASLGEALKRFQPPVADAAADGAGDAPGSSGDGGDAAEGKKGPVRLDMFELADASATVKRPGAPDLSVTGATLDIRDFEMPSPAGKQAQIGLRLHPFEKDAKVAVKVLGRLAPADDADRDIAFKVDAEALPLVAMIAQAGEAAAKSPLAIKDGELFAGVEGTLKGSRLDTTIGAFARDLDMETNTGSGLKALAEQAAAQTIKTGVESFKKPGTNETHPLVFAISVDFANMTREQIADRIRRAVRDGVLAAFRKGVGGQLGALPGDLAKQLGAAAGQLGSVAGQAQEGLSAAKDAAESAVGGVVGGAGDAVKGAGDAVKGVTSGIGGLFGGGKKDKEDEKKKP
ncbi:MAG: AsmA family protein [Candidatus Sumerlaeia bacterium]|nr:AsmA family protein [Candidatus Sumerlaeia bacterium]